MPPMQTHESDEPVAADEVLGAFLDLGDAASPGVVRHSERPLSADRLPTLTEVVELGRESAFATVVDAAPLAARPVVPGPVAIEAGTLVDQVLAELAPRIDVLFEARLREALAPAVARAADGLIRDTRDELSPVLRALVAEVVARALEGRELR